MIWARPRVALFCYGQTIANASSFGGLGSLEVNLKTIEVSDKELTYLLIALRNQEQILVREEDETMEDALADLLIVQALINKLTAVKALPEAP